jgi:hypothetical protein
MTLALAKICLAASFFGLVSGTGTAADAAVVPFGGHGNGSGNGSHNKNSFIINSPNDSHDFQHLRNVNLGGNTITPAAVCRAPVRRCRIVQKVVVYPHWG